MHLPRFRFFNSIPAHVRCPSTLLSTKLFLTYPRVSNFFISARRAFFFFKAVTFLPAPQFSKPRLPIPYVLASLSLTANPFQGPVKLNLLFLQPDLTAEKMQFSLAAKVQRTRSWVNDENLIPGISHMLPPLCV